MSPVRATVPGHRKTRCPNGSGTLNNMNSKVALGMDVKKAKPATGSKLKRNILLGAAAAVLLVAGFSWYSGSQVSIDRAEVVIAKVQKGDLQLEVKGFGVLQSDNVRLITAMNNATVKKIRIKPGSVVSQDSVIVELDNPELKQIVENAKQALSQAQSNLAKLKVNNELQRLKDNETLNQTKADYEVAKFRLEAESQLAETGIVSVIDLKESEVNVRQLKARIGFLQQKAERMKKVQQELENIENNQVKQKQGQLAIARENLDSLMVRAGFDGILQKLSVQLGQSVTAGQEIAWIGGATDLIALIRVPQNQASSIEVGHKAIIDTRRDKIEGEVVRIDPVVNNNTVAVEVNLPSELPDSARPELNVDGIVVTGQLNQVLYIERPANVREQSEIQLYQLNDDMDWAERTTVSFGAFAGRYIEIKKGLAQDQQLIISDLSNIVGSVSEINLQ